MSTQFNVSISLPRAAINGTLTPDKLDFAADSINDALKQAVVNHPEVFKQLLNDGFLPRRFVNMYVNAVDHRLTDLQAPLTAASQVRIVTSISGG